MRGTSHSVDIGYGSYHSAGEAEGYTLLNEHSNGTSHFIQRNPRKSAINKKWRVFHCHVDLPEGNHQREDGKHNLVLVCIGQ